MGWSSGSRLFSALIETIRENVPNDDDRKVIYTDMIGSFQEMDWDTLDECVGEDDAYDEIYFELYPQEDEEEEGWNDEEE